MRTAVHAARWGCQVARAAESFERQGQCSRREEWWLQLSYTAP